MSISNINCNSLVILSTVDKRSTIDYLDTSNILLTSLLANPGGSDRSGFFMLSNTRFAMTSFEEQPLHLCV